MKDQVGFPINPESARAVVVEAWLRKGDRLYQSHLNPENPANALDEALNQYAQALEQEPECALVMCRMATLFLKQGHYAKAEQYAQKSLKLLRATPAAYQQVRGAIQRDVYYSLGVIHYRYGRLELAATAFQQSVQADVWRSSRARFGLFQVSRDQALTLFPKPIGILQALKAVYGMVSSILLLPLEPERLPFSTMLHVAPHLLLAWMHEEFGLTQEALTRYLKIHRTYPGLEAVGLIIGSMYQAQGEPEQARHWFESVMEKHPGSLDAYYHLARLHEDREEYAEMANVYERLLRLKPGDPHVYCNLANAYYYMQRYKEALAHYESALQLGGEPRWKSMVAQSMANIHCDYLQNTQTAIAYYQMAKDLDPTDIENYIQLGMLYFQKEDFANAEFIYRQAARIAPNNPRLYSNLGYLRWMENDVDSALTYYEKAISLDSGYEIPINNMGVIYLDMLGQVHKSIALFQEAISLDPQYALAYYNLGRAYSFLDMRLEAASCFHTAQELNHYSRELDHDELTDRINHLFDTCEMELRD